MKFNLAAFATAVLCLVASHPASAANTPLASEEVHAFLENHCLQCHRGEDNDTGLQLDDLIGASATTDDRWMSVLEQVQLGQMPPEDSPEPDRSQTDSFLALVAAGLDAAGKTPVDLLGLPGFGNFVAHEDLFDPKSDAKPASPARLWRVNPDIFASALIRFDPPPKHKREDPIKALYKESPDDIWLSSVLPSKTPEHAFEDHAVVHDFDTATTAMLIDGVLAKLSNNGQVRRLARQYLNKEDTRGLIDEVFARIKLRSPSEDEARSLQELVDQVENELGAEAAVSASIAAVLLSAETVFRVEIGQGQADPFGRVMLSPHELAFAISYSLTGAGPDKELLEAAVSGELSDRDAVRQHVQQILDDHDAHRVRTLKFFREFFEYPRAMVRFRDAEWLVGDADNLVLQTIRDDREVFRRLLTTNQLLTEFQRPDNARYQRHYQKAFGLAEDTDWTKDPPAFESDQRAGLLTHPAWLQAFATADGQNEAIQRGRWVRTKLLGETVPPVPVTVNAMLPHDESLTLREKMQVTHQDYCWSCHKKMDDLGLPFEQYDPQGLYRETELDQPVVTTGLVDSETPSLNGRVDDPIEMMHLFADSPRIRQVMVRHAFRYWLGRNETVQDAPTLVQADRAYVESGGSLKALVTSLLTSDSFLYRRRID